MTTENQGTEEQNWLMRMHSFLQWKLVCPELNNPYERKFSEKAIKELSEDLEVLKRYSKIRGLMDGEEIICISDLTKFEISTEHPSLSKLHRNEVKGYLETSGVLKDLEAELRETQSSYKQALKGGSSDSAEF